MKLDLGSPVSSSYLNSSKLIKTNIRPDLKVSLDHQLLDSDFRVGCTLTEGNLEGSWTIEIS